MVWKGSMNSTSLRNPALVIDCCGDGHRSVVRTKWSTIVSVAFLLCAADSSRARRDAVKY